MKHLKLSVVAFLLLVVVGCSLSFSHSTHNDGFDFPSGNVNKIMIGKTTGNELIQMFGGPLSKSEASENEEQWMYSSSTVTKYTVRDLLNDKVETAGQHKTLYIRLKNGIVTNFSYTESLEP